MTPGFGTQGSSLVDWETLYGAYRWDSESGFYQVRFRYLQPKLGRWLSRDALGARGGLNLYLYVSNSPLNGIDILGLEDCRPGDRRNPTCETKVLAFGSNIKSEDAAEAATKFFNAVESLDNAAQITEIFLTGIAAGSTEALAKAFEAIGDKLGDVSVPNKDDIIDLARKAAQIGHGAFGGYYLYTRITYEECTCSSSFFGTPKKQWTRMPADKNSNWKRSSDKTPHSVLAGADTRYETPVLAAADAGAVCAKKLADWERTNLK